MDQEMLGSKGKIEGAEKAEELLLARPPDPRRAHRSWHAQRHGHWKANGQLDTKSGRRGQGDHWQKLDQIHPEKHGARSKAQGLLRSIASYAGIMAR